MTKALPGFKFVCDLPGPGPWHIRSFCDVLYAAGPDGLFSVEADGELRPVGAQNGSETSIHWHTLADTTPDKPSKS